MTPTPRCYVIVDVTGRRYIPRSFASIAEAARELADLLRPYPAAHPWRKRLSIAPRWSTKAEEDDLPLEHVVGRSRTGR